MQAELPGHHRFMSRVQFQKEEAEKMNRYHNIFSPPLRSFLLQRGRDRKEISTDFRRDLRERSRERGGVMHVWTHCGLLVFGPAGSQGGKPCPRHLCSKAESVIVGYTHSAGMLCNRLRPAMRERRNRHGNTEAGHVLRESGAVQGIRS